MSILSYFEGILTIPKPQLLGIFHEKEFLVGDKCNQNILEFLDYSNSFCFVVVLSEKIMSSIERLFFSQKWSLYS